MNGTPLMTETDDEGELYILEPYDIVLDNEANAYPAAKVSKQLFDNPHGSTTLLDNS